MEPTGETSDDEPMPLSPSPVDEDGDAAGDEAWWRAQAGDHPRHAGHGTHAMGPTGETSEDEPMYVHVTAMLEGGRVAAPFSEHGRLNAELDALEISLARIAEEDRIARDAFEDVTDEIAAMGDAFYDDSGSDPGQGPQSASAAGAADGARDESASGSPS